MIIGLELLTMLWLFQTTRQAQSTLNAHAPQAEFATPANRTNGFTVKLTVELRKFDSEKTILEIPPVLKLPASER